MRRQPLVIIKSIVRLLGGHVALSERVRDGVSGLDERGEPKLLAVGERGMDTAEMLGDVRVSRAVALDSEP